MERQLTILKEQNQDVKDLKTRLRTLLREKREIVKKMIEQSCTNNDKLQRELAETTRRLLRTYPRGIILIKT